MRLLLWISIFLAAIWSGYWYIGQSAFERGAEAFFQQAQSQGLVAQNNGLSIHGYPNRFDLTVTEPKIGDPRRGLEWSGPFIQILTLSYTPWHVIAAFPPTQVVTTPLEDITITSDKLQASVVVSPTPDLPLVRTAFVGSKLAFASTRNWSVTAEEIRFATRADPSIANAHDIGLEVKSLTPDPTIAALMPDLPATIALIRLDALASLSAPIDRHSGETRPTLTALSIKEGIFNWGALSVFAKGDLDVVSGYPAGRITIRIEGWRNLVTLAVAVGAVQPDVSPTVERMLETMATSAGNPEVLELPLIFANGRMSLGPLPLGPAPRLN